MFGSFRLWFDALPLTTKRAVLRERLLTYLSDPMAEEFIRALPPDVKESALAFRACAQSADWSVTS